MTSEHSDVTKKDYTKERGARWYLKVSTWIGFILCGATLGLFIWKVAKPEAWSGYLNTKFITVVMNLAFFNGSLLLFDIGKGIRTLESLLNVKEKSVEYKKLALCFYIVYMLITAFLIYVPI